MRGALPLSPPFPLFFPPPIFLPLGDVDGKFFFPLFPPSLSSFSPLTSLERTRKDRAHGFSLPLLFSPPSSPTAIPVKSEQGTFAPLLSFLSFLFMLVRFFSGFRERGARAFRGKISLLLPPPPLFFPPLPASDDLSHVAAREFFFFFSLLLFEKSKQTGKVEAPPLSLFSLFFLLFPFPFPTPKPKTLERELDKIKRINR